MYCASSLQRLQPSPSLIQGRRQVKTAQVWREYCGPFKSQTPIPSVIVLPYDWQGGILPRLLVALSYFLFEMLPWLPPAELLPGYVAACKSIALTLEHQEKQQQQKQPQKQQKQCNGQGGVAKPAESTSSQLDSLATQLLRIWVHCTKQLSVRCLTDKQWVAVTPCVARLAVAVIKSKISGQLFMPVQERTSRPTATAAAAAGLTSMAAATAAGAETSAGPEAGRAEGEAGTSAAVDTIEGAAAAAVLPDAQKGADRTAATGTTTSSTSSGSDQEQQWRLLQDCTAEDAVLAAMAAAHQLAVAFSQQLFRTDVPREVLQGELLAPVVGSEHILQLLLLNLGCAAKELHEYKGGARSGAAAGRGEGGEGAAAGGGEGREAAAVARGGGAGGKGAAATAGGGGGEVEGSWGKHPHQYVKNKKKKQQQQQGCSLVPPYHQQMFEYLKLPQAESFPPLHVDQAGNAAVNLRQGAAMSDFPAAPAGTSATAAAVGGGGGVHNPPAADACAEGAVDRSLVVRVQLAQSAVTSHWKLRVLHMGRNSAPLDGMYPSKLCSGMMYTVLELVLLHPSRLELVALCMEMAHGMSQLRRMVLLKEQAATGAAAGGRGGALRLGLGLGSARTSGRTAAAGATAAVEMDGELLGPLLQLVGPAVLQAVQEGGTVQEGSSTVTGGDSTRAATVQIQVRMVMDSLSEMVMESCCAGRLRTYLPRYLLRGASIRHQSVLLSFLWHSGPQILHFIPCQLSFERDVVISVCVMSAYCLPW